MGRTGSAYQLKITLRGSRPPIWRRVIVPGSTTLEKLHEVIQVAMGWTNGHLHAFEVAGTAFSGPGPDGYVDDENEFEDERKHCLAELMPREKMKFRYEYDFGDGWEHDIVVEKIMPPLAARRSIVCTGGKMCCPAEDCGGLAGHYRNLHILADEKHPEHAEVAEWVGGHFDPEAFDLQAVNDALGTLRA
jgi:hypothetical protein